MSHPVSDEDLARQTQAGSLEAFEELVHRYECRIYAFVTHWRRETTDAREVTQDTFVRAFQAIRQFNPKRSFPAWLFSIARRKALDHLRRTPVAAEAPPRDLPCNEEDPSEVLSRRDDSRAIWDLASRRLPRTQFEALWLRYVEDMSVAETATALGLTVTHVKVLLFRARQALCNELSRERSGTARPARRAASPLAPREFPSGPKISLVLPK